MRSTPGLDIKLLLVPSPVPSNVSSWVFFACPSVQQGALTRGSRQGNRAVESTIQWTGLRAALDAANAPAQNMATTEEAFTLLVRFGQAPSCGSVLEPFARKAEELRSKTLVAPPHVGGIITTTPVVESSGDDGFISVVAAEGALSVATAAKARGGTENGEGVNAVGGNHRVGGGGGPSIRGSTLAVAAAGASSVLLGASEIAFLATELDPMSRIDSAITAAAEALGGDAIAAAIAERRRQRRCYRSPLHSYAVTRRCHRWKNELEKVGDRLATTRRRLGQRGHDLLLADSRLAAIETEPDSSSSFLPAEISADELIAQAKAVTAMAARRQQADEAGTGSEWGASGIGREGRAILTAQIHRYAPLLDRSSSGVRAFDGWGYYGGRGAAPRREDEGEPVAVLEVSPALGRKESSTTKEGGSGGKKRTTGEALTFAMSVLSVRALRGQPGLLNMNPRAIVVEDGKKSGKNITPIPSGRGGEEEEDVESAAGGPTPSPPAPVQIVCERLEGWRPLCDVILEHGPLVTPSDIAAGEGGDGLRVLRLWGGQLAAALGCLASTSLVLRDLRASTVFVSPDGSTVKVVAFSSLATVSSNGRVLSPEAPDLDRDIHGPTMPLTPPEALTIAREYSSSGGGGASGNHGSWDNNPKGVGHKGLSLVLADSEKSGENPATTAAWDVWTLGILLFELAFGHPPPAYGNSLRQGLASLTSDTPAAGGGGGGGTNGAHVPSVGDIAAAIHYDFLSAVGGQTERVETGEEFTTTTHVCPSPLEKALKCMSLGAAIGERDPLNEHPTAGRREAAASASELGGEDGGRKSAECFRRAWVRRQLQMEESGEIDVMTWQAFQDKLGSHLDVSIAPATAAQEAVPLGGGDESGGRRKINSVGPANVNGTSTTSPPVRKRTARAWAKAAVDRTAARLAAEDPRGTGRLPFSFVRRVLRDELQLSFAASEAKLVAYCLEEAEEEADDQGGGEGGQIRRGGEGSVYYRPLVHILHVSSLSAVDPALEPPRPTRAGGQSPSPPPTPTAFVELLGACLEPNPDRRLSPPSLQRMPFFSTSDGGDVGGREKVENADDLQAASAYMGGSGNELSPTLALRERVESRIQALEAASAHRTAATAASDTHNEDNQGVVAVAALNHRSSTSARPLRGRGVSGVSTNFGAGALVEALKELERLVHRSSPTAHTLTEGEHPQQARRMARGHAKVVDEIFKSDVLCRASALALQLLGREEVHFACFCASSVKVSPRNGGFLL